MLITSVLLLYHIYITPTVIKIILHRVNILKENPKPITTSFIQGRHKFMSEHC